MCVFFYDIPIRYQNESALLSQVDNSKVISIKRIWCIFYLEYKFISPSVVHKVLWASSQTQRHEWEAEVTGPLFPAYGEWTMALFR